MIYNRSEDSIEYEGKKLSVGMRVFANKESEYYGLYGYILEIRTDSDRETENDTPDIHCWFDAPVMPNEVTELEARFSALYQHPMTLADISLDLVIMSPEMLDPAFDKHELNPYTKVFALIMDYAHEGNDGVDFNLFSSLEDARSAFHERLSNEKESGGLDHCDQIETSEDYYECWKDNDYGWNHFKLVIEERLLYNPYNPSA